eukprot:INCI3595.3.p1 GENE.INCI3595.3~~INCI3595.3.p1  ORF type:complete len:721 (+),score=108.90 INCI3595.3:81-2243(+)
MPDSSKRRNACNSSVGSPLFFLLLWRGQLVRDVPAVREKGGVRGGGGVTTMLRPRFTLAAALLLLLLLFFVLPAAGWLGASLVRNVPQGGPALAERAETPGLEHIFPTSISHFFRHVYDTDVAYVNRNLSHLPRAAASHPFEGLWPESPQEALDAHLRSIFETFVSEGKHAKKSALSLVQPGVKYKAALLPESGPDATFEGLQRFLANGYSFVFKFESLTREHAFSALERDLFNATGLPISVHLYVSARGQMVLEPHTDPYDVLVLQLQGQKHWHTCTPRQRVTSSAASQQSVVIDDAASRGSIEWHTMSPAQRCMLRELQLDKVEGCTIYTVSDTDSSMDCHEFDMHTGDVLYMPKGVVHFAETLDNVTAHLTIGFHRGNVQWLDLVKSLIANVTSVTGAALSDAISVQQFLGLDKALTISQGIVRDSLALLEVYSSLDVGMHLQEAVPGWLLKCVGRSPWCSDEERDALEQDLHLLTELHIGRFGSWTLSQLNSQVGLAAVQAMAQSVASPDYVLPLWTYDSVNQVLKVVSNQPSEFVNGAFRKLARITQKKDAVLRQRKKKPSESGTKRGKQAHSSLVQAKREFAKSFERRSYPQKEAFVQSFGGERGVAGSLLCDEMRQWSKECMASTDERCEVFITADDFLGSCNAYCQSQGLSCTDGYDDSSKGNCVRAPKGSDCQRGDDGRFATKICACVRGPPAAERVNEYPAFPGNRFENK